MGEHWYTRTGESAYSTNGRDTTLRDARKLGLVPSVTTVLSVMHKGALVDWLVKQGIMAALTGTRTENETDDAYIARILRESKQQAIDAADEGTRIHDACEHYVKTGVCPDAYRLHAEAAVAELHRLFPGVNDWVAEQSFGHPLGYGGKVDLHSPSTGIVCDYKTKDGDFSDGKRLAYDQHYQLAAYQVGLGLCSMSRTHDNFTIPRLASGMQMFTLCANIFVSRTHPGKVASHVWSADEIAQGWRVFECALNLWRELKGYDPGF